MSWTNVGADDPGWSTDTSSDDPGWTNTDADSQSWSNVDASSETWSPGEDGTDDLWNRLGPREDAQGGVDFVSVLGGGWVLGTGRNTIRLGGESPERKP